MINVIYILSLLILVLNGCANIEKNHYGHINKVSNSIVHKGDTLTNIIEILGTPDDSNIDNNGILFLYYISLSTKNDVIKYNYSFEADALIVRLKDERVISIEPIKDIAQGDKR